MFAVVVSVVGLGWLFSQIYYKLDSSTISYEKKFYAYEQLASHLIEIIKKNENPEEFVASWNIKKDIQIAVQHFDDYPLPVELSKNFKNGEVLYLKSDKELTVNFYIKEKNLVLILYLSPKLDDQSISWLNLILTLSFYLSLVVLLLAWLYPLIRRLSILRKTARKFGEGNLNSRVKSGHFTYIADIEQEFNHMADRIEGLLKDNKLLSRAVSHDLKTPLARLRFGIDALSECLESEREIKYISRIQEDLTEMESLVETLLNYARLDKSYIETTFEAVDLCEYIETLFKTKPALHLNLQFDLDKTPCWVMADKSYLPMVFKNLMSNCQRFALERILISVLHEKDKILVVFEDDGPGLSSEALDSALQPFWRDSRCRKINSGGHGMGLAIAGRVAGWHKADVHLDNSTTLGGAKVSVLFNISD